MAKLTADSERKDGPADLPRISDGLPAVKATPQSERPSQLLHQGIILSLDRRNAEHSEAVRGEVAKLQETLRSPDVLNFSRELGAVQDRNQHLHDENVQLRGHCQALLNINTELRQKEIDSLNSNLAQKVEHLTKEMSHLKDIKTTNRQVVEMMGRFLREQEAKEKGAHPVESQTSAFDASRAVQEAMANVSQQLLRDVDRMVEKALTPYKEGLDRTHQNTTRLVTLCIQNQESTAGIRTCVDGIRGGDFKSNDTLHLLEQQMTRTMQAVMENRRKIQENEQSIARNKEVIKASRDELAAQVEGNKEMILENRRHVEANAGIISENAMMINSNRQTITQTINETRRGATLGDEAMNILENLANLEEKLKSQTDEDEAAKIRRELEAEQGHMSKHQMGEIGHLRDKLDGMGRQLDTLVGLAGPAKQPSSSWLVEQLKQVSIVQARGNAHLNLNNGDVTLLRPIKFVTRNPGELPIGEFEDEAEANQVISDIAALWKIFQVDLNVEGHSRDIGQGNDDFWQSLTDNRAALCVPKLHNLGVPLEMVHTTGKPGKKGLNKAALVLKLDIFPDID